MNRFPIDKDEVLRYLGYRNQNLDEVTDNLINECMEEIRGLIREKHIYRFFDIYNENGNVHLSETNLTLTGNDIKNHLGGSESCVLMAVTLGNNVDSKIRYYERKSITRALILDACATTAVEEICDEICEDLEETTNKQNKTLTSRYSPGYGDLPIDIQKDFLSVLGAEKAIGLTANSHSILIPRKSVTAIAGVMDIKNKQDSRDDLWPPANHEVDQTTSKDSRGDPQSPAGGAKKVSSFGENTCLSCKNYSTCMYRREGGRCGAYRKA
jgi:hypothetical protein